MSVTNFALAMTLSVSISSSLLGCGNQLAKQFPMTPDSIVAAGRYQSALTSTWLPSMTINVQFKMWQLHSNSSDGNETKLLEVDHNKVSNLTSTMISLQNSSEGIEYVWMQDKCSATLIFGVKGPDQHRYTGAKQCPESYPGECDEWVISAQWTSPYAYGGYGSDEGNWTITEEVNSYFNKDTNVPVAEIRTAVSSELHTKAKLTVKTSRYFDKVDIGSAIPASTFDVPDSWHCPIASTLSPTMKEHSSMPPLTTLVSEHSITLVPSKIAVQHASPEFV